MGKIYPAEFKKQAVELYRLDERTTYADVARDLGCSAETVRNWVAQNDIDEGRRDDGLTSDERERLRTVERDNRRLEKENRILKQGLEFRGTEVASNA